MKELSTQTSSNSRFRQVIKAFVALLVTAVVTALAVAILFAVSAQQLENIHIAFLFAFAFTAAYTFILGGPLLLLGAWRHAVRWWSCVLIGFLVGLVPSALVAGTPLFDAWPLAVFGAIGGLVFWLLWHFWVQRSPARRAVTPVEQAAVNGE
jgi:hypothetical protein